MTLISASDLCFSVGGSPLLDHVSFQVEKGERICLLGRNGVGKSTLIRIISGQIEPDSGEVRKQQGLKIGMLTQDVPVHTECSVFDEVIRCAEKTGGSSRFDGEGFHPGKDPEISEHKKAEHFRKAKTVLSRFDLDPDAAFDNLSAGMKRRVLFAGALSAEPDLLLLDEPTNHLDIETIDWMESFILKYVKTLFLVTHDRVFLQKVATRIMEIDRGNLFSYPGDYRVYLKRRQSELEAEEKRNAVFDQKLAREEDWIRQGIKARRTRNEGRVTALEEMRKIRRDRQKKIGNVSLNLQDVEKSGKLVIEAAGILYSEGGIDYIRDFSNVIARGDKVGIIGPNGTGKTTLLKLLLKQIDPKAGYVRHGAGLQVAYFDQLRSQIDMEKTVRENIVEGNDFVIINDQKRHVIGYLQDFLFAPDRARSPVHILSGGEKNRLMLAKLFARPANLLVMDEPTNDLDVETLELLEELLFQYKGTLLLVSHDRAFLNNVVTSTLVFEGEGRITAYAGGYDDWLSQKPVPAATVKEEKTKPEKRKSSQDKRLGYMEKRELETLPQLIDQLETEQENLYAVVSEPLFYKKEKEEIAAVKARMEQVASEIDRAYMRWEWLDAIAKEQ